MGTTCCGDSVAPNEALRGLKPMIKRDEKLLESNIPDLEEEGPNTDDDDVDIGSLLVSGDHRIMDDQQKSLDERFEQ